MKPDFAFACTLFGYEENYTREKAVSFIWILRGVYEKVSENLSQCIEKGFCSGRRTEECAWEYAQRKAREIF